MIDIEKIAENHRQDSENGECARRIREATQKDPLSPSHCALCYYLTWNGIQKHLDEMNKVKKHKKS